MRADSVGESGGVSASAPRREEKRELIRFLLACLSIWVVTAAVLLALRWQAIALRDFIDVDDQLRLVEVRDWLAGQSFYDVTQYRMNEPWGASMHWSRLVDMPLAALMIVLRPLLGAANAETVSAAAVPLVTLAIILIVIGLIGRRLGGDQAGILSCLLSAMCLPCLYQVAPLRVDHHGWETCFSLLGLLGALDANGRRSGVIAGLAMAVAVQISLEQLPFAAILGIAFTTRWLFAPEADARRALGYYVGVLAGAEFTLFAALHAASSWPIGYCDAVSPPQLLLLAVSAIGVITLTSLVSTSRLAKLVGLSVTGGAALLAFRAWPPHCGPDAFQTLEPIARALWYDNVLEGRPVWLQTPVLAAGAIGFPIVALTCAAALWRGNGYSVRWPWLVYTVTLIGATVVAVLVNRAGALASVIAAPVAAATVAPLMARCLRSASAVVRVLGTTAIVLALSPLAPLAAASMINSVTPDDQAIGAGKRSCRSTEYIRALSALPPSRMLAPLDLAPAILLETRHAPLASGHHRNHVAMAQVITAFTGKPSVAHVIVRQRALAYVILCPDVAETRAYVSYSRAGLAARLMQGEPIGWLAPVHLRGSPIRVWRVVG